MVSTTGVFSYRHVCIQDIRLVALFPVDDRELSRIVVLLVQLLHLSSPRIFSQYLFLSHSRFANRDLYCVVGLESVQVQSYTVEPQTDSLSQYMWRVRLLTIRFYVSSSSLYLFAISIKSENLWSMRPIGTLVSRFRALGSIFPASASPLLEPSNTAYLVVDDWLRQSTAHGACNEISAHILQ